MQMGGGALIRAQIAAHDAAPTATRERLTAGEIAYVEDRRRSVRASWQACATIISRPVHDVRMACDADYARAYRGDEAPAVVSRGYAPVLGDDETGPSRVLLALATLERRYPSRSGDAAPRITAVAVAVTMGMSSVWVGHRMRKLELLGLALGDRRPGASGKLWCLTARGKAEARHLEPVQ